MLKEVSRKSENISVLGWPEGFKYEKKEPVTYHSNAVSQSGALSLQAVEENFVTFAVDLRNYVHISFFQTYFSFNAMIRVGLKRKIKVIQNSTKRFYLISQERINFFLCSNYY